MSSSRMRYPINAKSMEYSMVMGNSDDRLPSLSKTFFKVIVIKFRLLKQIHVGYQE